LLELAQLCAEVGGSKRLVTRGEAPHECEDDRAKHEGKDRCVQGGQSTRRAEAQASTLGG
jgi:hypothetical protein